jgi:ADP-dependent phosphofructokinase/glucokinase
MVTSFILWTIMAALYENHNQAQGFGIGQIVFVWVFGIFYSIGFSGLLVAYTLEVLPYHLRAKGVMIMNITVQAILAISAQTNPIAIEHLPHGWNFWLFYTVRSTFLKPFDVFDDLCALIRIVSAALGCR